MDVMLESDPELSKEIENLKAAIASLLIASYRQKKPPIFVLGEMTYRTLHAFGASCLKADIDSTLSGTHGLKRMPVLSYRPTTEKTRDFCLLDAEGTPTVLSAKLCSSMNLFSAVHGVSMAVSTSVPTTLTFSGEPGVLDVLEECIWNILA